MSFVTNIYSQFGNSLRLQLIKVFIKALVCVCVWSCDTLCTCDSVTVNCCLQIKEMLRILQQILMQQFENKACSAASMFMYAVRVRAVVQHLCANDYSTVVLWNCTNTTSPFSSSWSSSSSPSIFMWRCRCESVMQLVIADHVSVSVMSCDHCPAAAADQSVFTFTVLWSSWLFARQQTGCSVGWMTQAAGSVFFFCGICWVCTAPEQMWPTAAAAGAKLTWCHLVGLNLRGSGEVK